MAIFDRKADVDTVQPQGRRLPTFLARHMQMNLNGLRAAAQPACRREDFLSLKLFP
jgi:hypothetical protein